MFCIQEIKSIFWKELRERTLWRTTGEEKEFITIGFSNRMFKTCEMHTVTFKVAGEGSDLHCGDS